jgi:hypothetical protein
MKTWPILYLACLSVHPMVCPFIQPPQNGSRWRHLHSSAGERCTVSFDINVPLLDGSYELGVDVTAPDLSSYFDRLERALTFQVTGREYLRGLVDLEAIIEIERQPEIAAVPVL